MEHISSTLATTTYAYDLNNNLTKITDALGNIRNFTYDGLSRWLTAQDLHASGDGTYGSWTYSYDDASNMTQQVDPKSQTVNWTYDALNRPLTEDYTESSGTEVTYTYDGSTNGKGRLCVASSTGSVISNLYNPLGFVQEATTTIAGTGYKTTYAYDRLGDQTFLLYPDSAQVGYVYNSAGRLDSVVRKESTNSASSTVASHFGYSPLGQPSSIAFNNYSTPLTRIIRTHSID